MNEWTVVLVLVSLVNLFMAVYNPMSKSTRDNTRAMTELTVTIRQIASDLTELKTDNKDSHKRMHERNDKQDDTIGRHAMTLDNHENRLQSLEKER